MKYSLRSLMTFSIRDLFLVTVIVALALGWGVDRSNRLGPLEKEVRFQRWKANALEEVLKFGGNSVEADEETVRVDGPIGFHSIGRPATVRKAFNGEQVVEYD